MTTQVLESAMSIFMPYLAPIILILLAASVADRLRETVTDAFLLVKSKRSY